MGCNLMLVWKFVELRGIATSNLVSHLDPQAGLNIPYLHGLYFTIVRDFINE